MTNITEESLNKRIKELYEKGLELKNNFPIQVVQNGVHDNYSRWRDGMLGNEVTYVNLLSRFKTLFSEWENGVGDLFVDIYEKEKLDKPSQKFLLFNPSYGYVNKHNKYVGFNLEDASVFTDDIIKYFKFFKHPINDDIIKKPIDSEELDKLPFSLSEVTWEDIKKEGFITSAEGIATAMIKSINTYDI